jgi:anionic cell wall polymer biosynthesis LytR-Cps2A-Psr (LCP) family protein
MDRSVTPARPARRLLLGAGLVVLLLCAAVVATVFVLSERLGNNVERIPAVFASLEESTRPPATDEQTFLLVGTDSRSATTGTLMLAQVSADRSGVVIVSLPANTWVDVPGRGSDTIDSAYSAYSTRQPALLVQTVETLTSWHIDHVAVVDFARFDAVVDTVGGIEIAGTGHLDGAAALAYLAQQDRTPEGDLEGDHRQQDVLRAVLGTVMSSGTVTSPAALVELLEAMSRSVSLDDTLTNDGLRSLSFDLRGLRPTDFTVLDAPVGEPGVEGGQAVVHLDAARSAELWDALRNGTALDYANRHPEDLSGPTPG